MSDDKNSLITVEILKARYIEKLKQIKAGDGIAMWGVSVDLIVYAFGNYDRLTPEAQKLADALNDEMMKHVEESIKNAPDDVVVREAKRLIRGHKGKRWHVKLCLDQLEKPLEKPKEIALRCKEIVDKYLQPMVDMYQDILEHTLSGPVAFSQVALLGACFDELFVAFHLSQRSYTQQAFSHLRTIQEALDLIHLFRIKPEEVNLWISDEDGKKIWNELKPSMVKKKIGSDSVYDQFYRLFSNLGTHPSFNMMRLRCKMLREKSPQGNPSFLISLGGTPNTKEAYFSHIFVVMTIMQIFGCMIATFHSHLNQKEMQSLYEGLLTDFKDMVMRSLVFPLENKEMEDRMTRMFALIIESTRKIFNVSM